jgi:hypothetical protein
MTRQEAISYIESLFPPDSSYDSTAKKGRELLERAKRDISSWKNESDEVLIRFAQLCMEEDYK